MTTCFLFASGLTDEGCLCLSLDQQGEIRDDLNVRSFQDIQALQANAKTIVVLSGEQASLQEVELPWLQEKKARTAIPYALEDKLAANIDEVHIAYDRAHFQNGRYLLTICNHSVIEALVNQLNDAGIDFNCITVDWFALKENELAVTPTGLLVYDKALYCGFLSDELAHLYPYPWPEYLSIYTFVNSKAILPPEQAQQMAVPYEVWIAERLNTIKTAMNLCQGTWQKQGHQAKIQRWYWAAGAMTLLWLTSFLVINGLKIHSLGNQLSEVDQKIAGVYHQFFPDATQVISPRYRIEQLLKSQKQSGSSPLWPLLDALTLAVPDTSIRIQQFKFQNQSLQVTVLAKDFDVLESLQGKLQQAHISAKQLQASSQDKQVIATLELSL